MTPPRPPKKTPVRLQDVADEAGVSLATASLARRGSPLIAAGTRERVREAEKTLGYRAAPRQPREEAPRRRRQCRSLLYCIIDFPLRQSQYADFLNGVMDACQEQNIRLQLRALNSNDPEETLSTLHEGVDGILITGEVRPFHQEYFSKLPIPTLMLGNYHPLGLPAVELHLPLIAESLASRIAEDGHKEVAHVLVNLDNYYDHFFLSFLQSELEARGVRLRPEAILHTEDNPDAILASGRKMLELQPGVTGFTCGSAAMIETIAAEFVRMEKRGITTPTAYGITGGRGLRGMKTLDLSLTRCGRVAVSQMVERCENPACGQFRTAILPGGWNTIGKPAPRALTEKPANTGN